MFEKFKKNKEVMNILNKLNSNTSTGYIVGGAVRFIAKTGFTLDEESFNAIQNNGYLINTITKERIHDEFTKLMKLPNYIKSIDVMKETGLLSEIITIIRTIHIILLIYGHIQEV